MLTDSIAANWISTTATGATQLTPATLAWWTACWVMTPEPRAMPTKL